MEVPEYKVWELERRALRMLAEHLPRPLSIPVDIELLAESGLGLRFIDVRGLRDRFSTLGLLARRRSDFLVVVDQGLFDFNPRRYRFTVAEEVAHFELHKDLFEEVESTDDAIGLYHGIVNLDRVDRNAKRLAAALLVPKTHVVPYAEEFYRELVETAGFGDVQAVQKYLAHRLANLFDVSFTAMKHRLSEYYVGVLKRVEESMSLESKRLV